MLDIYKIQAGEIASSMSPSLKVSPPEKVGMLNSEQLLMEMGQAGQSNVSLATGVSANALGGSKPTEDVLQPDTRRLSSASQTDRRPPALSISRKSYLPVVPSPLNPSTSSTSVNSSDEAKSGLMGGTLSLRDSSSSGELPIPASTSSSSNTQNNGTPKKKGKGLSSPQQFLRRKSELAGIGMQIGDIRMGTPKGLKDLGHDYSRYPSSRCSSTSGPLGPSGPHTPLPVFLNQASTSSDSLPSIPRNPFRDSAAAILDPEKWNYPDDHIGAFDPYFGGGEGIYFI
ncbi:beta-glucan synthesis-associated protein [Ciborinia camelliae]|nr:beta-glucan synthesis-associated protein [Ciborinia camelliae]